MMRAYIQKSELEGSARCPPSKSETHREIFIASLTNGVSTVKNPLLSRDTLATINACRKFGANISIGENNNLTIKGKFPFAAGKRLIDAENSGTTIRISAALSSLVESETTLEGDASLSTRPMMPLISALRDLGAICSTSWGGVAPLTVMGKVRGGEVNVEGTVSSQFVSGLMIAAPLMQHGLKIKIHGRLVSYPYLDGTIAAMDRHGVEIRTIAPYKKYSIAPQEYRPADCEISGDWSSAALLISACGLVGGEMKIIDNISKASQGDRAMIGFAEQLGMTIKSNGREIWVESPQYLNGGRFDLNATPDLLPAIAILSLKSRWPIEIFNVAHARNKETDRIKVVCEELGKMGIMVRERADGMTLTREGELSGAELDSHDDHRLFMAFAIAGMYVGDCSVSNPESVDVSFPGFIEEMTRLRAKIEVR